MDFKLKSDYKPTGDQPQAIKALVEFVKQGKYVHKPSFRIITTMPREPMAEILNNGFNDKQERI